MSHVAVLALEIQDLDSLAEACKTLGLELVKQSHYRWYGRSVGDYPLPEGFTEQDLGKCEYVIRIPDNDRAYEIGVVPSRTGEGYTLLWDFFAGGYGMEAVVGENGYNLQDAYAAALSASHYEQLGYMVTQEKNEAGEIILTATR